MSAKATFWAWEQDLPSSMKLVLLAYANYASCGYDDRPKIDTVIRMTGLSYTKVKRAISELNRLGYLEVCYQMV